MGAFSKIKDAIFGSEKTDVKPAKPEWEKRTRPTIKFASPISRTEFEASWIGGERTKRKKVGVFSFTRINGNVEQDLGSESDSYPLTFFFNGPKHDLTAKKFWEKSKEVGRWQVWHPKHGRLYLQLHSITEIDAPVEDANTTAFNSDWSEPINPETLMTGAERDIDKERLALDALAADEFSASYSSKPGALNRLKSAVAAISGAVDKILGPIVATNSAVQTAFLSVNESMQQLLNAVVIKPLSLVGQIQATISLPAKIVQDKRAMFESYANLAEQIFSGFDSDVILGRTDAGSFNVARVKSLYATSIISAVSGVAGGGGSAGTSRADILAAGASYMRVVSLCIAGAEADQEAFSSKASLKEKYFAFETTYNQIVKLAWISYYKILEEADSLPVLFTFITERPMAPVVQAMRAYGATDAGITRFVEENDLKGIDIMLLEPGREFRMTSNG